VSDPAARKRGLPVRVKMRHDNHFVEKACSHGIIISMPDHGLFPQHLHQLGRETGRRVTGWDHGDCLHESYLDDKSTFFLFLFIFNISNAADCHAFHHHSQN